LDDRLDRGYIPDMYAMLHHRLARTLGHQHITVDVAKAAQPLNPARQIEKCSLVGRLAETGERGVKERCLIQSANLGNVNPPIAAPGRIAAQRPEGLSQGRHLDDSRDGFVLVLEADQRAPDRDAADKVAGAVDGIDDPAKARTAGPIAMLFPEEAVAGKPAQQ